MAGVRRSPQIGDLIEELSSRVDLVILDVPPSLVQRQRVTRHLAPRSRAPHGRAPRSDGRPRTFVRPQRRSAHPVAGVVMNQSSRIRGG